MPTSANICAGPFGRFYDFYIERPSLMQVTGRLLWGIDASLLYGSIDALSDTGGGATIVDVPCGGGVAFRALRPDQDVRYIAGDLDEKMLTRARRRAARRSLGQIEFVRADMEALPLADSSADVFVSFSGLHMLARPDAAASEIVRCLKPGGELLGTSFVREGARRQQAIFRAGRRRGHAEPPSYLRLRRALQDAGIADLVISPERGFVAFHGRKPEG
jgi:ubiquinone/menaquinone biosynthesis C-methylase UbiE